MASAPTCYFPDGSQSPRDTPCHTPSVGDGASACCAYADICLDNNLCLAQSGAEVITRGSCTDETWQSPECSQYCADVNTSDGLNIHLLDIDNDLFRPVFCCGQAEPSNNTCRVATKGSTSPFFISAGLVIFNRTSGSTSPNNTNVAPVTITATAAPITVTATASATNSLPVHGTASSSSSSSSTTEAAIGAGVGGPLGLGLLIMLGFLWRQRKQKQSLRQDVQTWEGRYQDLMNTKTVELGGAQNYRRHQRDGQNLNEIDSQPVLPHQLVGWTPGEIDGTQIFSGPGPDIRQL